LEAKDPTIAETALAAIITIAAKNNQTLQPDLALDRFTDFLFEGIRNEDERIIEFVLERLPRWHGPEVMDALVRVIESLEDETFQRVVEVLAEIGPAAGNQIVEKLKTASKARKLKLLDVIRSIANEETAPMLLPMAEDEDPEVRQRIAHVLGISNWAGAIPSLRQLAGDSNGHVRAAAYSALGWLATESEVDFILTGLNDRYPDVREAAVGAMIIIGGPKVVAKFTADLYHEDTDRQRLAVTALGWMGESDVVEPLLKAINHPDPGVRKSAVSSLARMGKITDLQPIKLALTDENSGVRKAAVSSLIALCGEQAIHDIRQLLEDPDVWVRYHTITSIGEMGNRDHAEYLMPYLEDDLDIIKLAAAKAMTLLGDPRAVPALKRLKQERNEDLVQAADLALRHIGGDN
jgi:HEAT repeat protein